MMAFHTFVSNQIQSRDICNNNIPVVNMDEVPLTFYIPINKTIKENGKSTRSGQKLPPIVVIPPQTKARRLRKAFGGGIRQGGVLAAAAMYALDNVYPRMHLDHNHAKYLSKGIIENSNGLVSIDMEGVHTNIVFMSTLTDKVTSPILHDRLLQVTDEERRVLGGEVVVKTVIYSEKLIRFVLHNDISADDVELAKKKFKYVLEEFANA